MRLLREVRRARSRALRTSLLALACLLTVMSAGCATGGSALVRPAPELLPMGSPLLSSTLEEGDAWVRHHLMSGEHARALELLGDSPVAPQDRLLRALQEAVVLHRAGEYERSNSVLDWAELEADRRYTRSISRGIAALGLGDRSLAYVPSPAELAMVPFYRMLNYLALGDSDGALVEARKANAVVAQRGSDDRRWCREDGMLSYLAGVVQSAGGEWNDALVSLRTAESSYGDCPSESRLSAPASLGPALYRAARAVGIGELADSVARRYAIDGTGDAAGGDVLLVIEEGFVAHRSAEALHLPILAEEMAALDGGDSEAVADVAARITARLVENFGERAFWGESYDDQQWVQWANAASGAYVLRLAWPGSRRESAAPAGIRVLAGESIARAATVGEISSLVERDLAAQRPAMLARLVARGLTKYLLTREVEEKAEREGGEIAGFIAGRIANLAGNELERADTRSWSLLPDRISLARLRLPPGTHHLRIETLAPGGDVIGTRDLGEVEVTEGGLVAISTRVWAN